MPLSIYPTTANTLQFTGNSTLLWEGTLNSSTSASQTVNVPNNGPVFVYGGTSTGVTATINGQSTTAANAINVIIPGAGSYTATVNSNGSTNFGNNVTYFQRGVYYWKVAYANGIYAAAAVNGNNSYGSYSIGVTTWNNMTMPYSTYWYMTGGNGYFVAIGGAGGNNNQVAYGTNGYTWSATTNATTNYWTDIIYGNPGGTPTFVAVAGYNTWGGTSSTNVASYTQNNGASWATSTMPYSTCWHTVQYGNGIFMAIAGGEYTSTPYVATTSNGYTWTGNANLPSYLWGGLTYTPATNYWTAMTTNNQQVGAYSNNNGASWTQFTTPWNAYYEQGTNGNGWSLMTAYNNQQGYNYSNNGYSWTAVSTSYQCVGIAFGNSYFVMSPNGNQSYSQYASATTGLPASFAIWSGPNDNVY